MSIVNLQRDAVWGDLDDNAKVDFSTSVDLTVGTLNMNSSGLVNTKIGKVQSQQKSTLVTVDDEVRSIGVFMQPPNQGEAVPFRVKAHAAGNSGSHAFAIVLGIPSSIIATDAVLSHLMWLPFEKVFDQLIMLPPEPFAAGQGLGIALAVSENDTGAFHIEASLSVQNLGYAPPAFSQSVG